MLNFQDFHHHSKAKFGACPTPVRTPDFISGSGSRYWDTGAGVIRAADHWGMMKNSFWTLNGSDWCTGTGYCAYSDFTVRKTVPVWHILTSRDVSDARAFLRAGGAFASSDWVDGRYSRPLPVWAEKNAVRRVATPAGRRIVTARPRVQYLIEAPRRILNRVANAIPGQRLKMGRAFIA